MKNEFQLMSALDNSITPPAVPVLYSFRRCPYAMRARMAILLSGIPVELRDILLKNKPQEMLTASPKATVPVLVLEDATVLEESLDILYWAFQKSDPDHFHPKTSSDLSLMAELIEENDGSFKSALDQYKYHVRFPEKSREDYRAEGEVFLSKLEDRLQAQKFLISNTASSVDLAIFPFIRQFANSDLDWFTAAPYPALQTWLDYWITSDLFKKIMKKQAEWQRGQAGPTFPHIDIPGAS